jgi:rod shape-determining protein MreB
MGAVHDVAVDLGTARVRVFAHGRGLVADEPSVVYMRRSPLALVAAGAGTGTTALAEGSFPVRPLREGVVRDVQCAGWLLSVMLRRARGLSLVRPTVLACVPSDADEEEIEALREALRNAGAARATVVPEPLAAAVGAGLDLSSPHTQMLVDLGEGVTEVAVIRNGLVEDTLARRVGCSDLRAEVMDSIARLLGVVPSEASVEELVRHAQRDYVRGEPSSVELTLELAHAGSRAGTASVEREVIAAAMEPVVDTIVEVVREAWRCLPDEVSCEVIPNGLWLTGGGACLPMLVDRISRRTGLQARVAAHPLHAVIRGASRIAVAAPLS